MQMLRRLRLPSVLAAALCGTAALAQPPAPTPAPAGAPTTVGPQDTGADAGNDIVVTAQRRSEISRDVPISITALDAKALERGNADDLTDIQRITPALRFDNAGTFFQPSVRGIGTSITTSGSGPNVGIYVDGFLVPNPESAAFELLNVTGIQVLKGPQGTLFGRNTTGGAILVTTAEPGRELKALAKASYGRFDEQRYQAYASVPLTDWLAVDAEGLLHKGDGYFTNILNGDDKVGRYENWSVRTGAKLDFSPHVSLLVRYIHAKTDDPTQLLQNAFLDAGDRPLVIQYLPASVIATRPGDVAVNPTQPSSFTNKSDTVQATLRADLGFADLTSYTQYRKDEGVNFQDLDVTGANVFGIFIGIDNKTVTQELLLTSKPGGRLQWTAGLYYFDNRDTYDVRSAIFSTSYNLLSGSSTTTEAYAGFADLTYELTPRLFLTAGARYSHDTVKDAYFIIPGSGRRTAVDDYTTNRVTPRFVVRYEPSDTSSVYASFSKGFKAGILNVGGNSSVPIEPEDIKAYEVGYKYGDRLFGFDLAGFYYDYTNLQVSSFQNGQAQIRNAASSRVYGVEGQIRYSPVQGLDLNAGAAYVDAQYRSFPNAPFIRYCTAGVNCGFLGAGSFAQVEDLASGQRMQRAPKFTGNFGATYGFDLGGGRFSLGGNAYYTSKVFFDPAAQFAQKGYATLSLRAEWEEPSKHFTIGVYGENVTDKRFRTGGNFSTLGIGSVWNAPATYGVTVKARY